MQTQMSDLNGRVAVVTGSGIGRGAALTLGAEGMTVAGERSDAPDLDHSMELN